LRIFRAGNRGFARKNQVADSELSRAIAALQAASVDADLGGGWGAKGKEKSEDG
jgi:hypothetical protein